MSKNQNKDIVYYGAATAYVSLGLIIFYVLAEGARRNFGDVGIFGVILLSAIAIVTWNNDSI